MSGLGKGRVLLTGSTGFLGQAVLERLLAEQPDTEVLLLVRGRPGISADERLRRLLTKPVFQPWRDRVGAAEAERVARDRVAVQEADIAEAVPDLPPDLSAVVHCASVVSFDPPVDEAFRTNLLGTVNLYEGLRRAAADRTGSAPPHLVHVSTAYVAGSRGGIVPEAPLDHTVNWRTELDWALAARDDVERDSRRPEVLNRAYRDARADHGKAGPQAVAAAAERRRRELATERLVEYGRARARSLGWPDVYTLTKALGERAAEETAGGNAGPGPGVLPLSIVRPAIVESALRSPYPGWIDGFKMADPVILAYGRGMLRYLAAIPDGAIDIVPVDYVVSALLAVAGTPPPDGPAYYHVGSGARNPLTVQRLYELVRGYFESDPLPDAEGRGAVRAQNLTFLSGARADRGLRAADRAMGLAERAVVALPASERSQEWQRALHRRRDTLETMRRYRDLYGAYVQAEVTYADDNTLGLHRSLPAAERRRAGFDTADIDWRYYLQDVHCPGVTAALRRMPARRPATTRSGEVDLPERDDVSAVFDLEGTVVASNVVEGYLWLRLLDAPAGTWPRALASLARSMPRYLFAERRDRGEFLRAFLERYAGADEAELRALARERLADLLLRRAWPQAVRRVRRHREAGHRTVLLTGALDIFVEPLHPLFDEVVGSRLRVVDGRCTGQLAEPPLVGESRAAWLRAWAGANGLDLSGSWAYGDHYSDCPVLELVGNPVAVNPDPLLYRHAKQRRWHIERWEDNVVGAASALAEVAR